MKTGLTYSALADVFSVHRTSISRIFLSTLQHLSAACENFVVWPSKVVVQATMPEHFKQDNKDCRVVIKCTEMYVEKPSTIQQCVQMYSNYKKGYTIKLLIACTPVGSNLFPLKKFWG